MRLEFLRRAGFILPELSGRRKLLGSTIVLAGILSLGLLSAAAPTPAAQEGQASPESIHYDSGGVNIAAFLAEPQGGGKHPAIILIHDNQGLTDGIRDIARQFASEGFVTLAPDLLSRAGGSKTPQQSRGMISQMDPQRSVEDLKAAFDYLQRQDDVDAGKISSVGLGWGGWRSFMLASTVPNLYRAVVYSGTTPVRGLETIHAPVMANYAKYDFFDAGNSIWTESTFKEMGKKFTYYIYPKTYESFFDAKSARYDAEAAKLAWTRTLDFLRS